MQPEPVGEGLSAAFVEPSALGFPLCVDLDGTLLCTDTLWEGMIQLLRRRPWLVFLAPFWLLRGRAHFKQLVSENIELNVAVLPYRESLVGALRAAKQRGRKLVLATAADSAVAERVAQHVGLFDAVFSSEGGRNLKAGNKEARLVAEFGAQGFDYVGDSWADVKVFRGARMGYLVDGSASLARSFQGAANVRVVSRRPSIVRAIIRQLRPHQWAKNALVVLPALLAPGTSLAELGRGVLAAAAFSLCASAGYVFNDLLDLEADRAHRTKRRRPLASGALPVAWGPPLFVALLSLSFGLAALLRSFGFSFMLAVYFVATLAYSFYLKRLTLLDVLVLAWLYTHRILSGSIATSVPTSAWLLAFSMFLFLSLAFVKRFVELSALTDDRSIKHRDYGRADIQMIASMGTASGYIAVMVFSLYVEQGASAGAYTEPLWLWFSVPVLLYWISRIWVLAGRGQLEDDPVKFALRDGASLACGAVLMLIQLAARYLPLG
jgi:4-hydroxybenzoate polyprenyltransferase/phosphoglycolate phosphatase-like HAD superfamily hydrolase